MRDIRMYTNGGMKVPVCNTTGEGSYIFSERRSEATCEKCKRIFPKRYPWAAPGAKLQPPAG